MACAYAMPMLMIRTSLAAMVAAATALTLFIPAADAGGRRDEQDAARRAMLENAGVPFTVRMVPPSNSAAGACG